MTRSAPCDGPEHANQIASQSDRCSKGYDSLAPWYETLERLRFGSGLQRARVALLTELAERLGDRSKVLFVGDGDGRLLEAFVQAYPQSRVTSIDISKEMIRLQQERLERAGLADRVQWQTVDIAQADYPAGHFDLIVTAFFLDCFTETQIKPRLQQLDRWLTHAGVWYVVDFYVPKPIPQRVWAEAWLGIMHLFFRWQTGLQAWRLVPVDRLLHDLGWECRTEKRTRFQLLRAAIFQRRRNAVGTRASECGKASQRHWDGNDGQ